MRTLAAPFLLLGLAACSAGSTNGVGLFGDAGVLGENPDDGAHDASTDPDGAAAKKDSGATTDDGGTAPTFKDAVVSGYSNIATPGNAAQTLWSASFALTDYPLGFDHPNCQAHDTADCIVRVCSGTSPSPVAPYPAAGLISVSGGKKPVSLAPPASGIYPIFQDSAVLWNGGETLTVSAAGGAVPAFSTTLLAPTVPTITSPAVPAGNAPLVVTRSSGLTLSWTGGNSDILAEVANLAVGGAYTTISCLFPAGSGSRTIPAAALGYVPAGPNATLNVLGASTKTVTAGGYKVRVEATSNALSAAGKHYALALTLQ